MENWGFVVPYKSLLMETWMGKTNRPPPLWLASRPPPLWVASAPYADGASHTWTMHIALPADAEMSFLAWQRRCEQRGKWVMA